MAIHQHLYHQTPSPFSSDSLYCEEESWEDDTSVVTHQQIPSLSSLEQLKYDLLFDDKELVSLLCKEQEQEQRGKMDSFTLVGREEAVKWMVRTVSHYGFTPLTLILAINYVDRFVCSSLYQKDNPWMIQLVAVTCLSLAAKVEETHVPLLLDLQVEDAKYVFEAKTIQRMELLVLTSLKWKMHPVTPLSFLDLMMRRIGLKRDLHWEFLNRCEHLLVSVVSDSRSVSYLPSVLATVVMMHVTDQLESSTTFDHDSHLLPLLNFIEEEQVGECYGVIEEVIKRERSNGKRKSQKRKYEEEEEEEIPKSPSGVIDATMFGSDSSNDSWSVEISLKGEEQSPRQNLHLYESSTS